MMLSEVNLQLLQSVPIFAAAEPEQVLFHLARCLEEVDYGADQAILTQGQGGGQLHIITAGQVKVHIEDLCITHLGVGEHFGEISLLDGQPPIASVTAVEPTCCLVLTQEHLAEAISTAPEIGLALLRRLAARTRQLNRGISGWLRGLLTVAWSDGEYSHEEQQMLEELVHSELCPQGDLGALLAITGSELAEWLGPEPSVRENFLRTATIVALANGTYSAAEDRVLQEFCQALALPTTLLDSLQTILVTAGSQPSTLIAGRPGVGPDPLQPVRQWLDELEIASPHQARFLCKLIPAQCPFERDIVLFGRKLVHIPPMCKLNPLYDQLVYLRFRALSYLADVCHEDVTPYIG
jgi:tellurite resistance protein